MPAGEQFDAAQWAVVARALEGAGRATGLTFSLRVGSADGPVRPYALRLHAERGPEAPDTVLVFVDPRARRLEIVTGSRARRLLDDELCARAAAAMTASFATGDLAGGLVAGLGLLGEPATRARPRPKKQAAKAPADQSTLF